MNINQNRINLSEYITPNNLTNPEKIGRERKINKLYESLEIKPIVKMKNDIACDNGDICSYITLFKYSKDWYQILYNLNQEKLNKLNIIVQEVGIDYIMHDLKDLNGCYPYEIDDLNENSNKIPILIHKNLGHSYPLQHCLISHSTILNNPLKIAYFEYMMYNFLNFFIEKAEDIPFCELEDFFVDEHDGFVETFGKIGYLPNLASRTTLKFFGIYENQIPANLIEKNRIISTNETNKPYSALTRLFSLLNEIRYVVGNHPNYQYFDSFIRSFSFDEKTNECRGYQLLKDIKKHHFYKRLARRMNPPMISSDQLKNSEDNYYGEGGTSSLTTKRYIERINGNDVISHDIVIKSLKKYGKFELRGHKKEIDILRALYDQPFNVKFFGMYKEGNSEMIILQKQPYDLFKYSLTKHNELKNNETDIEEEQQQWIALIENPYERIRSLRMIIDMLNAILYFRINDIALRDIKPGNILVTHVPNFENTFDERCIFCDFGTIDVAAQNKENPLNNTTEQYNPDDFSSTTDHLSCDVYSLAKSIVEFFLPFNFKTTTEKFDLHGIVNSKDIVDKWIQQWIPRIRDNQLQQYCICALTILRKGLIEYNNETPRADGIDLEILRFKTIDYYNKLSPFPYKHLDEFYQPLDVFKIIQECLTMFETPYELKKNVIINDSKKYYNLYYFKLKSLLKLPNKQTTKTFKSDKLMYEFEVNYEETIYDRLREIVTTFIHFLFTISFATFEDGYISRSRKYIRLLQQIMSLNLFQKSTRDKIIPTVELLIKTLFKQKF